MENHDEKVEKTLPKLDLGTDIFEAFTSLPNLIAVGKKAFDIGTKVKEWREYRNIQGLLSQTTIASERAKTCFKEKLKDPKFVEKTMCRLLVIVKGFDQDEKSIFCGKVFIHYLEEKINIDDFWEIIYALEKCYFDDLRLLNENTNEKFQPDWEKFNRQNQQVYSRLVGAGIFGVNVYDGSMSRIGSRIIHIMRDVL